MPSAALLDDPLNHDLIEPSFPAKMSARASSASSPFTRAGRRAPTRHGLGSAFSPLTSPNRGPRHVIFREYTLAPVPGCRCVARGGVLVQEEDAVHHRLLEMAGAADGVVKCRGVEVRGVVSDEAARSR